MRRLLAIENVPESWRRYERAGYLEYVPEEGLTITVPELAPLPEDIWFWAMAPQRDLPNGGASVRVDQRTDRTSTNGWPIVVCDSVALNESGEVLEHRCHLLLCILE